MSPKKKKENEQKNIQNENTEINRQTYFALKHLKHKHLHRTETRHSLCDAPDFNEMSKIRLYGAGSWEMLICSLMHWKIVEAFIRLKCSHVHIKHEIILSLRERL